MGCPGDLEASNPKPQAPPPNALPTSKLQLASPYTWMADGCRLNVLDRGAYVFSRFLRLIRHALPSWLARGPKRLGLKDISMPAGGSPPPWGGPDRPPTGPTRGVRQPKPDRPSGRSGAIAVAEPDEPQMVSAVATRRLGGVHNTSARK